jgi:hypothetical protein
LGCSLVAAPPTYDTVYVYRYYAAEIQNEIQNVGVSDKLDCSQEKINIDRNSFILAGLYLGMLNFFSRAETLSIFAIMEAKPYQRICQIMQIEPSKD